jgi:hypothetical protein
MAAELGIRLAKADSYILLGLGLRLGDLKFKPREKGSSDSGTSDHHDYTDDDFKKPIQ